MPRDSRSDSFANGPTAGWKNATKRSFDIIGALVLMLPALPLVVAAAVLMMATSRGPGLYSQIRITKHGREFRIWKVRSMFHDAEPDGIAIWPRHGDKRITPIGRYLRLLWIDELPQLWNVLIGDMSLVGPRPERPEFIEEFSRELPKYRSRLLVRAGLTGLAQVAGRIGDTSIRDRLAWDLRYIRNWSPWLDLKILVATIGLAVSRPLRRAAQRGSGVEVRNELRGNPRRLPERDQRSRPVEGGGGD